MASFPERLSTASRILISLLIIIFLFKKALFSSPLLLYFLAQLTSPRSSRMRFTTFTSLLAGAALVNASPFLEKTENVVLERTIEVVYQDCSVTTPKVFIISMVTPFSPQFFTSLSKPNLSSNPKLTFGTRTPIPKEASVTSLLKTSPSQASLPSSQTHTASPTAQSANSPRENPK
jgi:hypothetical protein